ncbi:hypothetical protein TNCV_2011711 [Trichonephila clavipes]|nr:hypothetical protein TNCV_2011711 [Trichonephila clavipes]
MRSVSKSPRETEQCDVNICSLSKNPSLLSSHYCNMRTLGHDMATVAEWSGYRIVADLVTGSSPVPLKIRCVGQRCTLNLSRAQTSSRGVLW